MSGGVDATVRDESKEAARSMGLRYVCDDRPGIRRVTVRNGFRYVGTDGRPIRDRETLDRIKSLAIPPAWTNVWICPRAEGHLLATGRDVRGRKQHRYHPRWRQQRDETKYSRLIAFGKALRRIRAQVAQDLALPDLPRAKVLATVVRLLDTTLIRVGNEEYARTNGSFGLTTFRDRHAQIDGDRVSFTFRGKSGVRHCIDVRDRQLARIVKQCQDLPGQELFQYEDATGRHSIDSADVNAYLRETAGADYTAKDFRTWAGTVLAAHALQEFEHVDSQARARKNILRAIENVAKRLGNTPAVCRKCYVHPAVLDAYLDGSLLESVKRRVQRVVRRSLQKLQPEEAAVLVLLQQRLRRSTKHS